MNKLLERIIGENMDTLLERINRLESRLEAHEIREHELMRLLSIERKYTNFYNEYISIDDCCCLIPFDFFDLYINGKLCCRECSKSYLSRYVKHVKDVRISLKEVLVDLITE